MPKIETPEINTLALDKVLAEMLVVRTEIDQKARRLQELAVLLSRTAKQTVREQASTYILYANAWLRFAGMVGQGLKRSAAADKVLKRTLDEAAREIPIVVPQVRKQASAHSYLISAPTNDDFAELYGNVKPYE